MKRGFLVGMALLLWGDAGQGAEEVHRVVFYNVENLMDTYDDPAKDEDEFTPAGDRHWTRARYERKLQSLFRVLAHIAEGGLPAVVGLAEIENRRVLNDLVSRTPLSDGNYRIIHRDSPDTRGIDVALLLRGDVAARARGTWFRIDAAELGGRPTRELLYVRLQSRSGDTLHLWVNHWPSRSGGEAATQSHRMAAAGLVRSKIDSILRRDPHAAILLMGDFNDTPADKSIREGLKTGEDLHVVPGRSHGAAEGTCKYRGVWDTFDQFIASGGLLLGGAAWRCHTSFSEIFSPGYLLEDDKAFMGKKPFRTYQGPMYHGGYSDHLPVYVDLAVTPSRRPSSPAPGG